MTIYEILAYEDGLPKVVHCGDTLWEALFCAKKASLKYDCVSIFIGDEDLANEAMAKIRHYIPDAKVSMITKYDIWCIDVKHIQHK